MKELTSLRCIHCGEWRRVSRFGETLTAMWFHCRECGRKWYVAKRPFGSVAAPGDVASGHHRLGDVGSANDDVA